VLIAFEIIPARIWHVYLGRYCCVRNLASLYDPSVLTLPPHADSANFYAHSSTSNFNNKNPNKVTPKICTIFVSDSSQWRRLVTKLFVPAGLIGNGASFAAQRANLAVQLKVAPSAASAAANVVNFSVLNKDELVKGEYLT
jgi:hypothetical protein